MAGFAAATLHPISLLTRQPDVCLPVGLFPIKPSQVALRAFSGAIFSASLLLLRFLECHCPANSGRLRTRRESPQPEKVAGARASRTLRRSW